MFLYDHAQVEKIRDHALEREKRGEIEAWLLELIYDAKLFKTFVPQELGGLGAGMPQALRLFERAAWIDGAFGWLVTIGAGGGFFSATLPEQEAVALFSGRDAVLAGSGMPTGTAQRTDGGYIVSGEWKYCSGSTYASFYTANCMIEGEGEPRMRSFAFLPEQVEIIRDWNSLGLRATSSHSIRVQSSFVPESMTFDIASEPRYDDPIYRVPFLPFAQTSFAAVSIGIARHFLEECRTFVAGKASEWSETQPGRLEALLAAVGREEQRLTEASDPFHTIVESSWEAFVQEGELSPERWDEVGQVSQQAASTARSGAQTLFPLLGMTGLLQEHPLNRTWRDLHTVTQHSVLLSL